MKNLFFLLFLICFCSCTEKTEIIKAGDEIIFSLNLDGNKIENENEDVVKVSWIKHEFIIVEIEKKATGFALVHAACSLSAREKEIEVFETKSIIRFEPTELFWENFFKENKESYIFHFWIFATEFE